jgi:arylsulfatase A-like enzyme
VDAFVHVNDVTPTMLEYAGAQHPGSTYKGHPVHLIMGKSMTPLLEGNVFIGQWKAEKLFGPPISDGRWHIYNIAVDIGENNNVPSQHPEILQKMISAYDKYAKEVGVIVPLEIGAAALQKLALGSD